MSTMKTMMPLMSTGEGFWDGEYIDVDSAGAVPDRHRFRRYRRFPYEEPVIHRQRNIGRWAGGRALSLGLAFRMQENGRLRYQTPRRAGEVREEPLIGQYPTIRLTRQRTPYPGAYSQDPPNARVHELIQQMPDHGHRARVWQWFIDDPLVQRTLITETRVSQDWR